MDAIVDGIDRKLSRTFQNGYGLSVGWRDFPQYGFDKTGWC